MGGVHCARVPAQSIVPPRTITTESGTGAAPVPSNNVAPTSARGGGGVPGGAENAVVTAIFKSGTNDFHGNAFEFVRNSALDARNFFDVQKPEFHRYQFGGSAGGPIKKNQTFFFADYEELRDNKGISHTSDTLSADARNGLLCAKVGADPCGSKTSVPISARVRPYLAFFPIANGAVNGDTDDVLF